MLTLTENARSIVKDLNAQIAVEQGRPAAALRISGADGLEPSFAVSAAGEPAATDVVLEQDGARVFLEETACTRLDDKVLDAGVDEVGNVAFELGPQPG